MSATKNLSDVLKAVPSVSDVTGKSIILIDGNGNIDKALTNQVISGLRVASADNLTTKQLTNEDNLNNIRDTNFSVYYGNNCACANRPNNSLYFSLQVFRVSTGSVCQIYTDLEGSATYRRFGNADGWKSWQQLATTDGAVAKLTTKRLTNEDLNTIKIIGLGTYFGYGNNTCINKPTDVNGFYLLAEGRDGDYCTQILITEAQGIIYKRVCDNGTWTSWKKMLTEDDIAPLINRIATLERKVS